MGTPVRIVLYARDAAEADAAARDAFAEIAAIDAAMSTYRDDSEISRLNAAGELEVSDRTAEVLRAAQRFHDLSDGAFDVAYAKPGPWTIDGRHVRLGRPGMRLDLGGIAKGYAADRALAVLADHGIRRALVDAGGDLAIGEGSWRIEGPDGTTIRAARCGVATSGTSERGAHIIDPATGLPAEGVAEVTVIAPDGITADALATAIFVLGQERGVALAESLGVEAHVSASPRHRDRADR